MKRYYAGIGSRQTPEEILKLFINVGKILAQRGYVLRSGHADGADSAFEEGCDLVNGEKEIYLPWKAFNGSRSSLFFVTDKAFEIAKEFHPNWAALNRAGRLLIARDGYQVLGEDLSTPSDFVICWTTHGNEQGGTGQAIRIARHHEIPICNIGICNSVDSCRKDLESFLLQI